MHEPLRCHFCTDPSLIFSLCCRKKIAACTSTWQERGKCVYSETECKSIVCKEFPREKPLDCTAVTESRIWFNFKNTKAKKLRRHLKILPRTWHYIKYAIVHTHTDTLWSSLNTSFFVAWQASKWPTGNHSSSTSMGQLHE